MGLIRLIFWFALFLASTFTFTVLFEHGLSGSFSDNAQKEWVSLQEMVGSKGDDKKAPPAKH